MLDECLGFLSERCEKTPNFSYEVLVVSDGSKDGTVRLAHEYSRRYGSKTVRVLDLQPNRGKGGAVRLVSVLLYCKYTKTGDTLKYKPKPNN
jgi:dolichyl-phosphate beta-glucosyltransferase